MRTSFSPAVRKSIWPETSSSVRMIRSRSVPPTPISRSNSARSSGLIRASSTSSPAGTATTGMPAGHHLGRTARGAVSSSAVLKTTTRGFSPNRRKARVTLSCSSVMSARRSGLPASMAASTSFRVVLFVDAAARAPAWGAAF